MQIRFKTSLKRVFKGELLVEVFFVNRCTWKRNHNLPSFSRFVHEMVWSKVMSREKTIIIEHERRKDTKATVIIIAV